MTKNSDSQKRALIGGSHIFMANVQDRFGVCARIRVIQLRYKAGVPQGKDISTGRWYTVLFIGGRAMKTVWNNRWNGLDSDSKRRIARASGFSESESALISKLYWEGFPVFIITQLQAVNWDDHDGAGLAADRAAGKYSK